MILKLDHFNPWEIAGSGQCFRWKEIADDTVRIVAFGRCLDIVRRDDFYEADCTEEEWQNIWAPYMDADTDYCGIESLIRKSGDAHLLESFKCGCGIRILKQDLWEVIISFLISQNNNIGRIKGSIEALCREAGIRAAGDKGEYAFPGPTDLDPEIFERVNLGLGYRVPYLKEMYEFAAAHPEWLDSLKKMSYEEARTELLKRKGIGPKVADCICLFGLHHIDAFPIDTHVKQLLLKYYPDGFEHEYFKGVAGVIQQYLFYYELMH
ncbi:MAG: 8-oxoguanine DNA glycosylase [Lachnospiraceae bacterium]|nr:8-oxoguanine DNA glycosylase [Lachnospiraceae bacterium]MBR6004208.1 8-oxoguanine DNA glycosylase [Lachnospiraceae bacterium]